MHDRQMTELARAIVTLWTWDPFQQTFHDSWLMIRIVWKYIFLALWKTIHLCRNLYMFRQQSCAKITVKRRTKSISRWRHQMETFSALLAICAGNSPVPGEFPDKGQWRGALMFSLICVWINGWVNSREAGDLRRYHAHYDVIVMSQKWDYELMKPFVWYRSVSGRGFW